MDKGKNMNTQNLILKARGTKPELGIRRASHKLPNGSFLNVSIHDSAEIKFSLRTHKGAIYESITELEAQFLINNAKRA